MNKIKSFTFDIAYRKQTPRSNILSDTFFEDEFHLIKAPFGYWGADPFVICYKSQHLLFAELYSKLRCKGYIAWTNLDKEPHIWHFILKGKTHFSFPYIFIENETLHIIPENYQSNHVIEYIFNDSLDKPIESKVLLNKSYVDNIYFNLNGRKMLFCYFPFDNSSLDIYSCYKKQFKKIANINDNLHCLRPAGKQINSDSNLYISQKCDNFYGESILINNIKFNNNTYTFTCIKSISADNIKLSNLVNKHRVGIHTFNENDLYQVIDIEYLSFDFLSFVGRLLRLFRKKQR